MELVNRYNNDISIIAIIDNVAMAYIVSSINVFINVYGVEYIVHAGKMIKIG